MTAVTKAILERKDQFEAVLQETRTVVGQATAKHNSNETLAFNKFTNSPPWGDWYKSDTWGKK